MKTRTYLSTHAAPKPLSRRRLHVLLCLVVLLALAACSSPLAPLPSETSATISDANIDAAALELARSEAEVQGTEGNAAPEGPETDLPASSSASAELSPQAVLPSVGGPLVFIRNVPGSAAPWQLWLADQATDVSALLYSGTRQIGSVAVEASGNLVFFTMQAAAGSSNYEVYRLTRSSGGVARLTNTSAAEADVSVSANGQTVAWGGLNSAGRRAVYLREYSGSTHTQKILSVSGGHQLEPSVSGDGAYVALVRNASGSKVMRFRKSNSSYTSVVSGSSSVNLRHPSVSNGGGKVMWLEENLSNSGSRIRVKTLSSGATATALSSTSTRFRHPHLTSDGAYFTYGAPSSENSAFQVFTRNLSTGQTARVTLENAPTGHDGPFWQKTTGSSATVTIRGTVTQGTGISSFEAADNAVAFDDHGKAPLDAVVPSSALPRLRTLAQQHGSVRVIVNLNVRFAPEGQMEASSVTAQRSTISTAQTTLLARLTGQALNSHAFETVPALALTVDAAGLEVLARDPAVLNVHENIRFYPSLAESVPLIGGNNAWRAGYDGRGWTVAVLDRATDTTHPFLSGRVVDEACFVSDNSCPNGTNRQTGRGSSVASSGENHGTHVSGIAVGRGSSFSGVARGANLMPIKVLSANGGTLEDLLGALEYVYFKRTTYNIAAVNLSLGAGHYTSTCDSSFPTMKTAIDNLRSVGIATIVASGNQGYTNGISLPACISSAISVGSTGDGSSHNGTLATVDRVSSFSNSASFLDFLAPGQWIESSITGGGFVNLNGTSMATPHVAGAWAVLKQRFPGESVNSIYNRLASTGIPVTDTRNSVTKPRIQLDAALGIPAQPAAVRVKLFRSATGALFREVAADSSGQYSFTSVPADSYFVMAYVDGNGNGRQDSTERAGAFGSAAVPQVINATSGSYTANITTGTPTEVEPNNGLSTTNQLLLSTHINGALTSSNTDFFKLQVPSSGSYTIETSGDCSGSRADTILELYTASGATLASDDDSAGSLCSRITYSFTQAGNYIVQVRGFNGDTGGYTLSFKQ